MLSLENAVKELEDTNNTVNIFNVIVEYYDKESSKIDYCTRGGHYLVGILLKYSTIIKSY